MRVEVTQLTDNAIVNKHGSIPTGNETKISLRKWVKTEHSPIRALQFEIIFYELPAYVAAHFKTHFEGVSLQVTKSNRRDYVKKYGTEVSNDREAPVTHSMICNAQTLINISRKRLCSGADTKTIAAWKLVKEAVMEINPAVGNNMVVECLYRGGICPEIFHKCSYNQTKHFKIELKKYLEGFKYDSNLYNLENDSID